LGAFAQAAQLAAQKALALVADFAADEQLAVGGLPVVVAQKVSYFLRSYRHIHKKLAFARPVAAKGRSCRQLVAAQQYELQRGILLAIMANRTKRHVQGQSLD
jgi:hypothetical protein